MPNLRMKKRVSESEGLYASTSSRMAGPGILVMTCDIQGP
jgi:hypothetical protein